MLPFSEEADFVGQYLPTYFDIGLVAFAAYCLWMRIYPVEDRRIAL
jgi:hypothetical protein